MQVNTSISRFGVTNLSNTNGLSPKQQFSNLTETNSEWQAQMSDSSESSSDSDDDENFSTETQNDGEGKILPQHANVSGSEAWYLKGRKPVT